MNSRIATELTQIEGLTPDLQQRLSELLDAYLTSVEQGKPLDRDQLLADNPELAEPLAEYLNSLELLQDAAAGFQRPADHSPWPTGTPDDNRQLGDFRIVREIGRGGMGVVYEACQISLNRRVALKVLPYNALLDAKQVTRFRKEAQAAAQLQHPGIVPVYAVGTDRGLHYYAMRYINGQPLDRIVDQLRRTGSIKAAQARAQTVAASLTAASATAGSAQAPSATAASTRASPIADRSALRRTSVPGGSTREAALNDARFPVSALEKSAFRAPSADSAREETVSDDDSRSLVSTYLRDSRAYFRSVAGLGIQAAEALQTAHEEGVVHRDIKPSNLLRDQEGKLWIADFGLARCRDDANLTRTGDLIGTMRYMSPEQTRGESRIVDHRTDIYSLGLTLYELLTFRHAVRGDDPADILRQIDREQPYRPRLWNKRIPADLENIVQKAISKSPDQRYATAGEMADDLRRFLDGLPTIARRPPALEKFGKWARRHYYALALLLTTLLLALAGMVIVHLSLKRQYRQIDQSLHQTRHDLDRFRLLMAADNAVAGLEKLEQGDWQAADADIQTALKPELAIEEKTADALRYELATLLRNLAEQYEEKDPDKAVRLYKASLEHQHMLKGNASEMPERRLLLGVTLARLSGVYIRQERLRAALDAFDESLEMLQLAASRDEGNPQLRGEVAIALNNYGRLLMGLERSEQAEEVFRHALALFPEPPAGAQEADAQDAPTRTAAENPPPAKQPELTGEERKVLASLHYNLGFTLERQRRWQEALTRYRSALDITQAAHEAGVHFPWQDEIRFDSSQHAGQLLRDLGRHQEALRMMEQCLAYCHHDAEQLGSVLEDLDLLLQEAQRGDEVKPTQVVPVQSIEQLALSILSLLAELGVDVRAEIGNNEGLRGLANQPAVQWRLSQLPAATGHRFRSEAVDSP